MSNTASMAVQFSEPMDATTITDSTLSLTGIGGIFSDSQNTVSYDTSNNTATYTLTNFLALGMDYTATISSSVADSTGKTMASDYFWNFKVRDGEWQVPIIIEASTEIMGMTVDGFGNAFMITNTNTASIAVARYSITSDSWSVTEMTGIVFGPSSKITADVNGNAIIIWNDTSQGYSDLYARRFNYDTLSWGSTANLENATEGVASGLSRVAMNKAGYALVAWVQPAPQKFNTSLYTSFYSEATDTWSERELRESDETGLISKINISKSGSDDFLLAWIQFIDGTKSVYASIYSSESTSWSDTSTLGGTTTNPIGVCMNESSEGAVVWIIPASIAGGTKNSASVSRYVDGAFQSATLIETNDTQDVVNIHIACDYDGDLIAIWRGALGSVGDAIISNRFSKSTNAWGTEEVLSGGTGVLNSSLVIDINGNAIAVFEQLVGIGTSIAYNRFSPTTGWGGAVELDAVPNETGNAIAPFIGMSRERGYAMVGYKTTINDESRIIGQAFR